jgi:hypothetical protein
MDLLPPFSFLFLFLLTTLTMRVSVLVSVSAVRPPPEAQPLIDAALKLESKSDRFGEINLVNDIEEEERKDDDAPSSSFSESTNNINNKYLSAETELPRCAMHLYRHISKVGGTTIRFIWDKNVVMGDWEYPIIYGFEEQQWTDLLRRWKAAAEKYKQGERQVGPRTLVELRGNWPSNWPAQHFQTRIMPDIDGLKNEFGEGSGYGCEITTSVLIREPTSQTLSFYEYYIRKQQEQDPGETKKMWPGVVGKESWGYDIGDYVASGRATNGQVREILGNKCTSNLREPGYETEWMDATNKPVRTHARPISKECEITESDYEQFEKVLKWFDVVGTTDNFDHFLLTQSRTAGVRYPQYKKSNSGKHKREWDPEVKAKVEHATTFDKRAHELAKRLQREQVEKLYGSWETLDERFVKPFKSKTEGQFVGGKPPKSLYKWVKTSEAMAVDAAPVVPDCWTDDTGGGQATAYIVFEPVAMVDKSVNLHCIKGCNFDS